MFLLVAFLIFTGALAGAAYYAIVVPQRQSQQVLAGRLRELRIRSGARSRSAPDLLRRQERGALAFLGDFFGWVKLTRVLQDYIEQANLFNQITVGEFTNLRASQNLMRVTAAAACL